MHPHQSNNLVVLKGVRFVDLYSMKTNELAKFEVGPDYIKLDGELIYQGGCMLTWPTHVIHRIITGENCSASINFAKASSFILVIIGYDWSNLIKGGVEWL